MATTSSTSEMGDSSLPMLFSALANAERRQLLGHLYDRAPDSLTRRDLATCLTPEYRESPTTHESKNKVADVLVRLQHIHLPKLDAAGLVDQDTDRGIVSITDQPAFRDPGIVDVITGETTADSEPLDALFQALVDSRRRTTLDVLSHQYQPIHIETLARGVGAKEERTDEQDVPPAVAEQVLISLTHSHIPALSAAGLIEYDADEETVAYEGHPDLRVPWMHSELGPDFRTSLTDSPSDADVGSIEGRERTVSYGQSLCDKADEELFMMFTTTDLLEAGCFTRIEQAVNRGVDVWLGTCDPTVREFIQVNAPEVTLWEPDTNWLDLPVEGDNVGRLVFADREATMIGTLGEKNDEGIHKEQAIVGEGEGNALVVMLRQMLQSRLEQVDGQSAELKSNLPF